jgi:hypothetical protein
MNRFLVFIVIPGGLVLSSWASSETVGAQSKCADSECLVSAGSSPVALVVALALLVFLFAYPLRAYPPDDQRVVGVFRRLGAFLLDVGLIMAIAAPIGAIPTLLAEYHYTDKFQWSFTREFARQTDMALILPVAIGIFMAMFFYFSHYPRKNRQTLGQYVLGYRVVAAGSARPPSYGVRTLLSFIGMCMWPISVVMALSSERKAFWWDAASGTEVVHVGS